MFSGIVETTGTISQIESSGSNKTFTIESSFAHELKIDQSIAHNGVCLTVIECNQKSYKVTAIEETLIRSNFGQAKTGDVINLERCLRLNDRLDGHLVQGHVDTKGICKSIENKNGSWIFFITHQHDKNYITVNKGSICVNGVSLTVVDSEKDFFSVAIIPYTFEHTNFKMLRVGDEVNLEFDIIGKYVRRMMA